ncbi:19438_t:CDS:2, partial [Racocetra fulgida]
QINLKTKIQTSDILLFGLQLESILKTIDQEHIAQHAYRNLATIENELPCEWMIADCKAQINREMDQKIKITVIRILSFNNNNIDQNEYSNIVDSEIVNEVVNILQFIVPDLIKKEILNSQKPVINLRISGDSRNVGKKVKHIMITFAILDDIDNIHNPDHYYI